MPSRSCYLDKLNLELPCECGNLSLNTQLPLLDAHWNDLIMSRAVPNSVKDIQILHHHMAIQTHIKYLWWGDRLQRASERNQVHDNRENRTEMVHACQTAERQEGVTVYIIKLLVSTYMGICFPPLNEKNSTSQCSQLKIKHYAV